LVAHFLASVNSFDELRPEDIDAPEDAWVAQLNERMEHLIERKRSSVQGREESLSVLSHLLMAHYAQRHVRPKLSELVPALLKCAKGGQSDNETALALKALSLLIITEPSGSIYDAMIRPLKGIISSSESSSVMVAAIHTLGIATFYGGVGLDETQEIMDFYLEIIESDGHSVEAADDGNVVAAALQEWGFLATQFEGMEDTSEEPMEAFVEQLESSDASVVIAAGENIALLFEKSWSELEEDEEPERKAEEDDEEESDPTAKGMVNATPCGARSINSSIYSALLPKHMANAYLEKTRRNCTPASPISSAPWSTRQEALATAMLSTSIPTKHTARAWLSTLARTP
jgi:hypothetical protein